jgi:uncharacterized 2Fe-2S/4Fe-4S cluster protein (DUF4445 family)
MHHLFAGLPVQQLGAAPYVPVITEPIDIPARDLGLRVASGAYVHLPPNIAGYVGADHVSMLLSTGVWEKHGTVIALDIGTNTEITLAENGRMLTCSCASGPAFEGAHIHDGMRAAPGAIEHVQMDGDTIRVYTIDELPAVGICGSGILDATAGMLGAGVIDSRGVIEKEHKLVRQVDREVSVPLVLAENSGHGRDIIVTRKDVNEIQLAKGAIRAGIEVLLDKAGIESDAIDEFVVAGAFGTYLDIQSAIRIGMFPEIPEAQFRQVGNAAGMGAKQMLISAIRRARAVEITQRVEYLELTTHTTFTPQFLKAMMF